MSTAMVSPPVVKAKSLSCPNCGGPVDLRGFAHTLNVVCPQCLSVLDASTPELQILQKFHAKERVQPKIPLGTRGKLDGTLYEVIGFQVREVVTEDDMFVWEEYLLFNPYKGFRYLSEYQGHWNFIRVLHALPLTMGIGGKPAIRMLDRNYIGFDTMTAKTGYVLGEFPWQVRVGDQAVVQDFVSPPYMLSSETTDGEVTWSLGEYRTGQQIWQALQLPDRPPAPSGIFANQPSPHAGKPRAAWRTWLWLMVALAAVSFFFTVASSNRVVFNQSYVFVPGTPGEPSFVTAPFELTGRTSNVELAINTDLYNNWAYFHLALINEESGQTYDFGREVSYYRDSGETEGKPNDSVIVPSVAPGRYYLRVEPEMAAPASSRFSSSSSSSVSSMHYQLVLRRDVPTYAFFWIVAALLLIPPIVTSARASSFESARWRESDYAPSASSSGGGGDD